MASMPALHRVRAISSHLTPTPAAGKENGWGAQRGGPRLMEGIKVVELATVIAAPACTAAMADFGAHVIKIERPGGDPWRGDRANKTPEDAWGGPHFAQNNRGKKSVVLDLKEPEHMEAMHALLADADVFVTSVRCGALDRMGLGYATLHERYPRLVYGILSAWGLEGPRANDPGYDVGAFWAAAGLQDFSKPTDDGHVGQFPPGVGDHMTSLQLLGGIGLALWHRDRTGQGQLVDSSLLRSGAWAMAYPLLNTALNPGGKFIREPRTTHYRPTFNVYKCADGAWIQLLGLDPGLFDAQLCECLEIDVNEIAKLDNVGQIAAFDREMIKRPSHEWEALFTRKGMWYQRALNLGEVLTDEQAWAMGTYSKAPGAKYPYINNPLQLSCSDQHGPSGPPPLCGEHTKDVLLKAGVDAAAVQRIVTAGTK